MEQRRGFAVVGLHNAPTNVIESLLIYNLTFFSDYWVHVICSTVDHAIQGSQAIWLRINYFLTSFKEESLYVNTWHLEQQFSCRFWALVSLHEESRVWVRLWGIEPQGVCLRPESERKGQDKGQSLPQFFYSRSFAHSHTGFTSGEQSAAST